MRKKRAFTLVEMLVVVFIIGLIVLVGVPAFNNFYQMYKFRSAMNQIVTDIRAARQLAITSNRPVKITRIDPADYPGIAGNSLDGYAIYILNPANPNCTKISESCGGNPQDWFEAPNGTNDSTKPAEKPRFFPAPVSFKDTTFLDIDGDDKEDIVFTERGEMYPGPYPPDGTTKLTFSEGDLNSKIDDEPHFSLKTTSKVNFNRYWISFALSGKVSVEPYRESNP